MDPDKEAAAWAQLEQEQEQELLRADPAFDSWLDELELTTEKEREHD